MIEINEPLKLLIAFVIGAVIGLEREDKGKKTEKSIKMVDVSVGVRTFSLIATLGAVSGIVIGKLPEFSLFMSAVIGILIISYYIFHSFTTRDIGITTEIALLYSYVLGVLISIEVLPIQVTLALSVMVLLMLSRKDQIRSAVTKISQHEINAFISFALIALVVLPFLPNHSYTLKEIPNLEKLLSNFSIDLGKLRGIELINPFNLWTIVALITGVDLLGYVLEKKAGQRKGWILASVAGGFISSTATTLSLAQESKTTKSVNHLVSAALFANMTSFFQIGLIIAALSAGFFVKSLPLLFILIISSFATAFYFYRAANTKQTITSKNDGEKKKEIINLFPALKFAFIYLIIQFVSKIALEFFGQTGFLAATAIGALTGLDAVIINTSQLAGGKIDFTLAVWALFLANSINLGSKTAYSFFQGNSEFALKFGLSMAIIIASSLVGLFFI